MLKSEKFFGKRDSVADVKAVPLSDKSSADKPASGLAMASTMSGAGAASTAATSASSPASSSLLSRVVPASIATPPMAVATTASTTSDVRSKLTVGPNIKLKGVEITDCDTLVVEGRVEATIDSRVIQISEKGAFIGSAEFDIAEIRGEFDGDLTVRQKLVVYASGRVTGKVRYGKLVIEEGGQLSGDVQLSSSTAAASVSAVTSAGTSSAVKGLAVALG